MFPNVGMGEVAVILLIVLLVMGPSRMPDVARALGKAYRTFQTETRKAQAVLKDSLADIESVKNEIKGGLSAPADEARALREEVRRVRASFDEPMNGVVLPPPPPIPSTTAPPVQPNPPITAPQPPPLGVIDLPDEIRQHEDT